MFYNIAHFNWPCLDGAQELFAFSQCALTGDDICGILQLLPFVGIAGRFGGKSLRVQQVCARPIDALSSPERAACSCGGQSLQPKTDRSVSVDVAKSHTHTHTWTSSCRVSCFRWLEGASTSRPLVDGRVYIIVDEIGRVYKLFRNYGLGFRHELRKNRTKRAN